MTFNIAADIGEQRSREGSPPAQYTHWDASLGMGADLQRAIHGAWPRPLVTPELYLWDEGQDSRSHQLRRPPGVELRQGAELRPRGAQGAMPGAAAVSPARKLVTNLRESSNTPKGKPGLAIAEQRKGENKAQRLLQTTGK